MSHSQKLDKYWPWSLDTRDDTESSGDTWSHLESILTGFNTESSDGTHTGLLTEDVKTFAGGLWINITDISKYSEHFGGSTCSTTVTARPSREFLSKKVKRLKDSR